MRVFLVRHGQTAWNVQGKAQGHADIPLDPTGQEQASALKHAFEGVAIDRIFCSDLVRAVETAEPISAVTGVPITLRTDIRERSFGEWEGMNFEKVARQTLEKSLASGLPKLEVTPPGGESFKDVWHRTLPFVQEIQASDETVVVVSHGGTCGVMLAQLTKGGLESIRSYRFPNTSVTELHRRPEGFFLLLRYADTGHIAMANELANRVEGAAS